MRLGILLEFSLELLLLRLQLRLLYGEQSHLLFLGVSFLFFLRPMAFDALVRHPRRDERAGHDLLLFVLRHEYLGCIGVLLVARYLLRRLVALIYLVLFLSLLKSLIKRQCFLLFPLLLLLPLLPQPFLLQLLLLDCFLPLLLLLGRLNFR